MLVALPSLLSKLNQVGHDALPVLLRRTFCSWDAVGMAAAGPWTAGPYTQCLFLRLYPEW